MSQPQPKPNWRLRDVAYPPTPTVFTYGSGLSRVLAFPTGQRMTGQLEQRVRDHGKEQPALDSFTEQQFDQLLLPGMINALKQGAAQQVQQLRQVDAATYRDTVVVPVKVGGSHTSKKAYMLGTKKKSDALFQRFVSFSEGCKSYDAMSVDAVMLDLFRPFCYFYVYHGAAAKCMAVLGEQKLQDALMCRDGGGCSANVRDGDFLVLYVWTIAVPRAILEQRFRSFLARMTWHNRPTGKEFERQLSDNTFISQRPLLLQQQAPPPQQQFLVGRVQLFSIEKIISFNASRTPDGKAVNVLSSNKEPWTRQLMAGTSSRARAAAVRINSTSDLASMSVEGPLLYLKACVDRSYLTYKIGKMGATAGAWWHRMDHCGQGARGRAKRTYAHARVRFGPRLKIVIVGCFFDEHGGTALADTAASHLESRLQHHLNIHDEHSGCVSSCPYSAVYAVLFQPLPNQTAAEARSELHNYLDGVTVGPELAPRQQLIASLPRLRDNDLELQLLGDVARVDDETIDENDIKAAAAEEQEAMARAQEEEEQNFVDDSDGDDGGDAVDGAFGGDSDDYDEHPEKIPLAQRPKRKAAPKPKQKKKPSAKKANGGAAEAAQAETESDDDDVPFLVLKNKQQQKQVQPQQQVQQQQDAAAVLLHGDEKQPQPKQDAQEDAPSVAQEEEHAEQQPQQQQQSDDPFENAALWVVPEQARNGAVAPLVGVAPATNWFGPDSSDDDEQPASAAREGMNADAQQPLQQQEQQQQVTSATATAANAAAAKIAVGDSQDDDVVVCLGSAEGNNKAKKNNAKKNNATKTAGNKKQKQQQKAKGNIYEKYPELRMPFILARRYEEQQAGVDAVTQNIIRSSNAVTGTVTLRARAQQQQQQLPQQQVPAAPSANHITIDDSQDDDVVCLGSQPPAQAQVPAAQAQAPAQQQQAPVVPAVQPAAAAVAQAAPAQPQPAPAPAPKRCAFAVMMEAARLQKDAAEKKKPAAKIPAAKKPTQQGDRRRSRSQ